MLAKVFLTAAIVALSVSAASAALCAQLETQYNSETCNDAGYDAKANTQYAPCGQCVAQSGVYLGFTCDEKAGSFTLTASFDDKCSSPLMEFDFTPTDNCQAIPNYGYDKFVNLVGCPSAGGSTTAKPTTAKPTPKPTTANSRMVKTIFPRVVIRVFLKGSVFG